MGWGMGMVGVGMVVVGVGVGGVGGEEGGEDWEVNREWNGKE